MPAAHAPHRVPPPLDQDPQRVRAWFDAATLALVPADDGTLATARRAAIAYAGQARAANTRRAYRAGVRAWCAWCERHALACLPGYGPDVAAFLAAERGLGRSVATVELRRAAIRALHRQADCAVPTGDAQVAETMAGIRRAAAQAGELPRRKLAVTAVLLRRILAPIGTDLAGLRDRAVLLIGFTGALRRAELAAIRLEHLEFGDRGVQITLPHSKGERGGDAVRVAIPAAREPAYCPVRALYAWQAAAGITEGALFRRVWTPPRGSRGINRPGPCARAGRRSTPGPWRASFRRAAPPSGSIAPYWVATASSAARSPPAWHRASIRAG